MMSSKSKDSLEFQELPENMEVGQVWGITWNASEEELVVIKKNPRWIYFGLSCNL